MQETSKPPSQQVHLAVPVTNPVPQSVTAQHLRSATGCRGSSGAPHLLMHFSADHQILPDGLTQLLRHLGLDYHPLQLSVRCSLQLSPKLGFQPPPAPLCLRVVVHPKDGGWRDTKVSKGNGQSILMSYIFAV